MHPLCRAVQAPAALGLFMPSFAPPDEYEKSGYTNGPCPMCGLEGRDDPQHLACSCSAAEVIVMRQTLGVVPSWCKWSSLFQMEPADPRAAAINRYASWLRARRYALVSTDER